MPNSRESTDRDVFVNCPFDPDYKQQFNALIFTIYDCGFSPRCALESADSGQLRFPKICELIRECRYGIHDLSRIELDSSTQLPRFIFLIMDWSFASDCSPPRLSTTQLSSATDSQCSVRQGLSPRCWCALSGARGALLATPWELPLPF